MPSAKTPLQFQSLTAVPLSDKERKSQTITPENIAIAVAALHRDGIVCLTNAVEMEHIETLNALLANEAAAMAKLPTTHFNDNSEDGRPTGNMSQGPPLKPDLMYQDIWANGPAAAVTACLLGPNPHVNYVNGNTALGGFNGARQNVHADLTFNHGLFPFALVTNYYLIDTSPANGSTELWLGTHRDTSFADHKNCSDVETTSEATKFGIRADLLEARRAYAPPIQASVPKGSVVIRDLRLWHAGLCNPSAEPRIMLAFVHTPWWYQSPAKVVLPEAAKDLVESWAKADAPVVYDAYYVSADIDHKTVTFNPNFSSANEGYLTTLPDLPMGYVFSVEHEAAKVSA